MTSNKKKITKEQYDRIMTASNGKGFVPGDMETEFFSMAILWGYGLYGTHAYEKNGEYWLDYTTGDSCD